MKIRDDYDFSRYDVNIQEFTENVRHIINYGLYDVKYDTFNVPTWTPQVNEHPIILAKFGASATLWVGDSNAANGWWYVTLTEL